MIALPRTVKVWAYGQPADLRKGYNGLVGLVEQSFKRDVMEGDLYLFVNKKRSTCKVLLWDGTGLCIFAKRLERGRFACLWSDAAAPVRLTSSELALFIEGCTLVGQRTLSPPPVVPSQLAVHDRV